MFEQPSLDSSLTAPSPEGELSPNEYIEKLTQEYLTTLQDSQKVFEDAYLARLVQYDAGLERISVTEISQRLFQESWEKERAQKEEIYRKKEEIDHILDLNPEIKEARETEFAQLHKKIQELKAQYIFIKFGLLPSQEIPTADLQIGNPTQLQDIQAKLDELESHPDWQISEAEAYLQDPVKKAERYAKNKSRGFKA